jgi:methyl-accepting chemotaxis protein
MAVHYQLSIFIEITNWQKRGLIQPGRLYSRQTKIINQGVAMDFAKAVDAHVAWIMKLQEAIVGGIKLDVAEVGKDTLCELGKWIYSLGTVHQDMAAFQNLKSKHAEFHQCAGEVVRKVNTGDVEGALNMVDKGGEFVRISSETISAIMAMKKELGM